MCVQCGLPPKHGCDVQLSTVEPPYTSDAPTVNDFLCYYHRKKYRQRGYSVALVLSGDK